MPTWKKEEAKESGWAQTREVIQSFEGDVSKVELGAWAPRANPDGTMQEPKEFIDITSINNRVLETLEEPSMDITASYNFRVNMSDFKGSFWVEKFLDACDKLHILLPDGLQGKHIVWRKQTQEAVRRQKGGTVTRVPEFDATNFIPVAVGASPAGAMAQPIPVQAVIPPVIATDPMELMMNLAIGKTDAQFKSAIGLDPAFVNSPYLPLAKSGAIMQTLLAQGKIKLVTGTDGKQVYSR